MSDEIIRVENLSKQYRLGEVGTGTISHDINRWWAKVRGKEDPYSKIGDVNDRTTKGNSDYVWALNNVNFSVKSGEILGVIGKNGAGKSTLLKLLSKVTKPSTGKIKLDGRIAALLEVGTGFHPELTGRENIYMNGTIMGMSKSEITRKFDEIVAFSGVEKYIDTPVKRYSSGMYVRLAFAVAAHLESEILIVDEVLAVGDADFQKKCLGKMQDVSGNGRTVLFVSHNMAAVNQLCTRCIYLKNGMVYEDGPTNTVVTNYLSADVGSDSYLNVSTAKLNRSGNKKVEFLELYMKGKKSEVPCRIFSIGESIVIKFSIKFNNPNEKSVKTAIELKSSDGLKIANMIDIDSGFQVKYENDSIAVYEVELNDVRFYPDIYYISLYAGDMSSTEKYDYIEDCFSFEIVDGGSLTSRVLPKSAGLLFLTPTWKKSIL